MDFFLSVFATITVVLGYSFASMRIVHEGNQALVERLGQYHRKLEPGLNFIIPLFDSIIIEESTKEKILDIEPQQTITKDNISVKVDAVVYWQVMDLEKTFYKVEDITDALANLVLTNMRTVVGELFLEETYSSRKTISERLLYNIDDITENWGIKINRVEIKDLQPVASIMESLLKEKEAENKKREDLLRAESLVGSIKILAQVLEQQPNAQEALKFFIAHRYVEANEKLGISDNSKVLFMDPKALNEALDHLMAQNQNPPPPP